jgi:hypothetical protein
MGMRIRILYLWAGGDYGFIVDLMFRRGSRMKLESSGKFHNPYKITRPLFNRRIMADATKNPAEKGGWSTGTKVLVGIVVLVVLVAMLAVFTLTIAVLDSKTGTEFPYTTTYKVSLPDGQPVTIGQSHILVTSYNDELIADVDGTKDKLVVGQERVLSPRHAQITIAGVPLIDTDFQITLIYRGSTGDKANFDMTIKTSKQIPEYVISRLIPPAMNAQPA